MRRPSKSGLSPEMVWRTNADATQAGGEQGLGQSLSSVEHKVDDFYTKIKDEIVEPDSGRMDVATTAVQKVHLGRTLVLTGMGAESRAEVDQPIKDAMGAGTV
ncbi:hypothetical protein AK812_SmicGene31301 [Symbiodinium microadriaticum]|uniref:Uncharacterized protein n=1 Tax=Symbiodinium microadriaticum TaxID=2951 RepID=A0A1Q9CX15_SYMMI|nr:hypothetical protein AK812_SmicGene31301 [Symbiodinium microadriaticum]